MLLLPRISSGDALPGDQPTRLDQCSCHENAPPDPIVDGFANPEVTEGYMESLTAKFQANSQYFTPDRKAAEWLTWVQEFLGDEWHEHLNRADKFEREHAAWRKRQEELEEQCLKECRIEVVRVWIKEREKPWEDERKRWIGEEEALERAKSLAIRTIRETAGKRMDGERRRKEEEGQHRKEEVESRRHKEEEEEKKKKKCMEKEGWRRLQAEMKRLKEEEEEKERQRRKEEAEARRKVEERKYMEEEAERMCQEEMQRVEEEERQRRKEETERRLKTEEERQHLIEEAEEKRRKKKSGQRLKEEAAETPQKKGKKQRLKEEAGKRRQQEDQRHLKEAAITGGWGW